jgi:hypothetical protein
MVPIALVFLMFQHRLVGRSLVAGLKG